MYGLINNSVRNWITERHGQEAWKRIMRSAKISDDQFVITKMYEDQLTYDLLSSAATELNRPRETVYREFGHYWISSLGPSVYGKLLDEAGDTFDKFMLALPLFHTRVLIFFPDIKPPHFETQSLGDGHIRLLYGSSRSEFTPFVIGAIEGLAVRFRVHASVEEKGKNGAGLNELHIRTVQHI